MASLRDPLVITDEQGRVVELNDAFTDLLGWSLGDGPFEVPHPWWPSPDADSGGAAAAAFGQSEPLHGEFPLVAKDGRDVWVEGGSHRLEPAGDHPTLVITSFRDVTREHWSRERRVAAAALAAEFSTADDLTNVLTAAVAGFAELFDGDSTVRVMAEAEDHVFTAAGPVRGADVEPSVWQALLGKGSGGGEGHPGEGHPGEGHPGEAPPDPPSDSAARHDDRVNGLLLAPDNRRADCRAWVQFKRPRHVTADERIVGDLMAQAFSLAVDRVVAASGFADRESHLAKAIESHRLIGQAIGILIERHRITPTEAFARLRRASQDRNIKLREIASRVIETGAEPDAAD
jgi:PAS domain S-box-containing protein